MENLNNLIEKLERFNEHLENAIESDGVDILWDDIYRVENEIKKIEDTCTVNENIKNILEAKRCYLLGLKKHFFCVSGRLDDIDEAYEILPNVFEIVWTFVEKYNVDVDFVRYVSEHLNIDPINMCKSINGLIYF